MSTESQVPGGRTAAGLCRSLRRQIVDGTIGPGELLPSVRNLSAEHKLSSKTVHRALRLLASEGLVVSEPRRGYRVLARANDPDRGCPIAYILSAQTAGERWTGLNRALLTSLQDAAASKGWSLLGTAAKGVAPERVIEQCRASRSWGAIIDVHSDPVVELAKKAGLTVVMVDAWYPDAKVDAILQDGFKGGLLAGRYLAQRGHKRIAWFGPVSESVHSMTRFGGAMNGVRREHARLDSDLIVETGDMSVNSLPLARELLSRKDRPTAVLALWLEKCVEITTAARELGMKLGTDLEVVGWSANEIYESHFLPNFTDGYVPPTVVWDVRTLAETAVARLAERRQRMDLPPVRINIGTRLKMGSNRIDEGQSNL